MIKKLLVYWDNFFYKVLLKNILKLSKLGYGVVVSGAESGSNFEHMYNNKPEGALILGKYIDKALLNLPAVHATRGRKDEIKQIVWNEINRNLLKKRKTKVLDLASGGSRYLRELVDEHNAGSIESICVDRDIVCVRMGRALIRKERLRNIRFIRADIFKLAHLQSFSSHSEWRPNIIIASGLLIYFSDAVVEKMLKDIFETLPEEGLIIFQSYEQLNTKKLMRKTMRTSSGDDWTLYYRKPEYWLALLTKIGYRYPFVSRDHWHMNNVISARR